MFKQCKRCLARSCLQRPHIRQKGKLQVMPSEVCKSPGTPPKITGPKGALNDTLLRLVTVSAETGTAFVTVSAETGTVRKVPTGEERVVRSAGQYLSEPRGCRSVSSVSGACRHADSLRGRGCPKSWTCGFTVAATPKAHKTLTRHRLRLPKGHTKQSQNTASGDNNGHKLQKACRTDRAEQWAAGLTFVPEGFSAVRIISDTSQSAALARPR